MLDVTALGELLIDFTSSGESASQNPLFEANPGGAVCNVLAMLAKLDMKTAFIGKVGDDMFGRQLSDAIQKANILCDGLVVDKTVNTTLAFVKTLEGGDRDFSFFRNNSADTALQKAEVNEELIKQARLFHFGSLSLTHPLAREATQFAVKVAKENNKLISFDPNLRPPLWKTQGEATEQIKWGIAQCDILKLAIEELVFITKDSNLQIAQKNLREQYPNIKLLIVTLGKDGSWAFYNKSALFVPIFPLLTIDTTGAGDTFFACCLHTVLSVGLSELSENDLIAMLKTASAAAGLVTTKKGALLSMPTKEQINALLYDNP